METCARCGQTFKNTHGLNIHRARMHGETDAFTHGLSGYTNTRCRCDVCRDAWRDYIAEMRLIRAERPIPKRVQHGNANTYSNHGCRCEACTAAASALRLAYRRRKKADT